MVKKYKYLDAMPWEDYQQRYFTDEGTENILVSPHGRQRVETIKKWIGTGKKVIDIASAWGGISAEIKAQGNDVTILDRPKVIEKAKITHPELKTLAGSALDIPTEDQFDVVLASEIIEHILDLDRFFSEIERLLKADGKLIVTTPNVARPFNIINLIRGSTQGWEYPDEPILHCRHFTIQSLAMCLAKYNFEIVELVGTESSVGMDWSGYTEEETVFLTKIIAKFASHPALRASQVCVLCKRIKGE